MKHMTVRRIATAAVVGALYVTLTYFGSIFGVTFGSVQCRFSEALCVLPCLFPETAWGLFAGCLISNLISPYGIPDLVIGSLTTLTAALLTARCRSRLLAPAPPVVLNALFVGGMLAWYEAGFGSAFPATFALNALTVAAGEAVACYGLGLLLLWQIPRIPYFHDRLRQTHF
ncbi:MAG: QueT transporter family protein [Oscillospiraceae bacterium]|nr:QueT transporter family protein [Oscillospiraceae bacterium]